MDTEGHAWLLEVNRLPGITSSKQNKVEEDIFFDGVIEGALRLCVVPPLLHHHPKDGGVDSRPGCHSGSRDEEAEGDGSVQNWECVSNHSSSTTSSSSSGSQPVGLDHDGLPVVVNTSSTTPWRNCLKFSLYAKKIVAGAVGGNMSLSPTAD